MPTTLVRWDPMHEFTTLRSTMDRLFDQSAGRFPRFRSTEVLAPAAINLDVYETGTQFVVKAALTGIDPKDVAVTVEEDVLTIKGELTEGAEESDKQYLRRELRYGSFQRSLRLPPTVDAEKAKAEFEHGVLRLTLPKRAEARARSIKITPQGVVDGTADQPIS